MLQQTGHAIKAQPTSKSEPAAELGVRRQKRLYLEARCGPSLMQFLSLPAP
jgi:hypothetical protein